MKYKRLFTILAVTVISRFLFMQAMFALNNGGERLYAQKGVINIPQEGLPDTTSYQIQGEWEFYEGQLLNPVNMDSKVLHKSYFDSSLKNANPESKSGTYRLTITSPSKEKYLLMLPNLAPAYKLWINGDEMENDRVNGTGYSYGYENQIVEIDKDMYIFKDNEYVLDIVLGIVTDNVYGDNACKVIFGKPQAVRRDYDIGAFLDTFAVGVYFVVLIYSLSLYIRTRRENYLLYLALMALVSLIKSMIISPSAAVTDILSLPYYSLKQLDIITSLVNTFLAFMLYYTLYPQELGKRAFKIVVWLNLLVITLLIFPSYHLVVFISKTYFLSVFWIVTLANNLIYIRAYIHKRAGVIPLIMGSTLYGSTAMFEIMVSKGYIQLGFLNRYLNMAQYGCLIFIIIVSIIISLRYGRRFNEADELMAALDYTNRNLESIVEGQTKELKDTNQKLEDAYKELLELQSSKQAMLLNISHDLRTPISIIMGYIDLMKAGFVDDEEIKDKYLKRVYSKVEYLSRMINDFFFLAKLEENKLTFNKSLVDINTIVQQAAQDMKIKAMEKGVVIHIAVCPNPVILEVDKFRLCQVLENTITNAIKHVDPGGEIAAGVSTVDGGRARIYIKDNGCGIEEKELPNIFDRYFKSKKDSFDDESTGLGLCIAREIVEKHGGAIWAESEVSKGTTIYITL